MNGGQPNWLATCRFHGHALVLDSLRVARARRLEDPLHRWVVWTDETEQERLRAYHQRAIGDEFRQRWTQTPLLAFFSLFLISSLRERTCYPLPCHFSKC